jgi:hypothetical protein
VPSLQIFRARLAGVSGTALVAALCALLAAPAGAAPLTQDAPAAAQAAPPESVKLSADQLDSMVAPIALYPDPLLAQCLVASTYPIDVVAAQQWLAKNSTLKGEDLVKAAEKEPWDPSVQALVTLPDALKVLSENIQWTQDLGDAFLASQADVMDAVQRMRAKAKDAGKLESTEQQKVETTTVESKTVIEIQPASTQVVYVPTYNPTVIWGPPVYPYYPMYYPPYYGGAWLGFGVGIAVGIGISGGWGWGCGWGGGNNNITINNNNNFVNNSNRQNNVSNRSGNSNWQHNAQQRGGAPYKDKATASKYGGGARGDSASRQAGASQRQAQGGASNRAGASSMDRGGSSSRPSTSSFDRGGSGSSSFDRGGSKSSQVGSRNVPSSSSRGSSSAFGGSSYSGSSARSSSSRGSSSMSGMSRGGGGGGRRR